MFVKKDGDGNWYVYKRTSSCSRGRLCKTSEKATYRNWFLIASYNSSTSFTGRLGVRNITLPQEFIGKKIRLRVEVLE